MLCGQMDNTKFRDWIYACGSNDWTNAGNTHRNRNHNLGSVTVEGGNESGGIASSSHTTTGRKTGGCSTSSTVTAGFSTPEQVMFRQETPITATKD